MYQSKEQEDKIKKTMDKKTTKAKKKTEKEIFVVKKKKQATHKMPDGKIMTGAKHSSSSKPIGKKTQ